MPLTFRLILSYIKQSYPILFLVLLAIFNPCIKVLAVFGNPTHELLEDNCCASHNKAAESKPERDIGFTMENYSEYLMKYPDIVERHTRLIQWVNTCELAGNDQNKTNRIKAAKCIMDNYVNQERNINLCGLHLRSLPLELFESYHLERINASNNLISSLPEHIQWDKFTRFTHLNLNFNKFESYPSVLNNYSRPLEINMRGNYLQDIDYNIMIAIKYKGWTIHTSPPMEHKVNELIGIKQREKTIYTERFKEVETKRRESRKHIKLLSRPDLLFLQNKLLNAFNKACSQQYNALHEFFQSDPMQVLALSYNANRELTQSMIAIMYFTEGFQSQSIKALMEVLGFQHFRQYLGKHNAEALGIYHPVDMVKTQDDLNAVQAKIHFIAESVQQKQKKVTTTTI